MQEDTYSSKQNKSYNTTFPNFSNRKRIYIRSAKKISNSQFPAILYPLASTGRANMCVFCPVLLRSYNNTFCLFNR